MTIKSRSEIGLLFETVRITGFGVEVGVERGWNAINILKDYKGILVCVDIWKNPEIEKEFNKNIRKYKDRIIKIKLSSEKAAFLFDYQVFDFVYIDADHKYDSVKTDHYSWDSKLRKGGIMSFHDYGVNEFEVKKYVDQLEYENIKITTDDFWEGKEYQTAYFYK